LGPPWRRFINGGVAVIARFFGMNGSSDDNTTANSQAVDWFVRLQSQSAGEEDWRAFERWLGEDRAHALAFEAVERLWVDLDLAKTNVPAPVQTAEILPFKRRRQAGGWRVWAAAGGVAAMLVAALAATYLPPPIGPLTGQVVATAKGQRKTTVLADGTRIDLDSATTIAIQLGPNHRLVRLLRGEAAFSVKPDPARPFVVTAADRRITDVGTVFDVLAVDDLLKVTVAQGEVAVAPAPHSPGAPADVKAGHQLLHQIGEPRSTIHLVDAEASMAWRSGRLVYQDAPLQAVAFDLNRYFPTPIRLKDDRAAKLRFSGVLVLDSEDAVVRRLQVFLPVAVERTSDTVWFGARPRS
jgi:transmembrane sensor